MTGNVSKTTAYIFFVNTRPEMDDVINVYPSCQIYDSGLLDDHLELFRSVSMLDSTRPL